MNSAEITRILRKRCRDQFVGVFAYDRLPKSLPPRRPLFMVCNTDPHHKPGRHWIVIYLGRDSLGEFFDSLNQPIVASRFVTYLEKHCKRWTRNNRQLQSVASRFCGNFCLIYCLFKYLGYSMTQIQSLFSPIDTGYNDVLSHGLTCRLR